MGKATRKDHRLRLGGVSLLMLCLLLIGVSGEATLPDASEPTIRAQRDLFVSSRNTNSVKRYDGETGAYLGDFVASGAGGLRATQEVAFGLDGHLYVSGRGNTAILKFDGQTGAFIEPFTSGYTLDNPTKMTFGPDSLLYVSQWGQEQSTVARFDAVTGVFVDEITPDLNQPMGHAWDADTTLYVVSFGSRDVRRYDRQGTLIDVLVSSSFLQGPVNLWFDGDDLLVVDWQTGSVKRFDGQTGAFKENFITGLTNAEGVTVGPDGALYLCDWQQNRVNRYDAQTGAFQKVFASGGGLLQPNSIVFSPDTPVANEDAPALPQHVTLATNYPNPFTPATTIRYSLPRPAFVTLRVLDLTGRTVATLVNTPQAAGRHEAVFDATGLPSGVYLYRLQAGEAMLEKTMMLIR